MTNNLELIIEDASHAIFAIRRGTRCEALDFLTRYEQDNLAGFARLYALLERIAKYGTPRNEQVFKKVSELIYEIKGDGIRLFCFYEKDSRRILIITHGWKKGNPKVQDKEIQRAERIGRNYLHA